MDAPPEMDQLFQADTDRQMVINFQKYNFLVKRVQTNLIAKSDESSNCYFAKYHLNGDGRTSFEDGGYQDAANSYC